MFFSSTIRPEPVSLPNPTIIDAEFNDQELTLYIKNDRREGNARLLVTMLSVGAIIEIIVFMVTYYLSEKIVAPVKDSYDKQKMFIANASHELKTPLAVIEANMEALEVEKGSEEWKENIETEITHANKLVLDLLQLARMDAGSIGKGVAEEVDLNEIVREQIEIFKPKFEGKFSFEKKTENVKRNLPKQDFVQVLDILLDNATKYGEKKIKVVLDEGGVVVTNDGTTVKKEDYEKIFDRFYQTDKTREGSGLGLAIAKAICEQNGWKITCESEKKTTKFVVRF
jgi:signal transduction histidine kinase